MPGTALGVRRSERAGVLADARIVIGLMLVATYVHLTVDDPSLFPLQPDEPIILLIVIGMASYVLWKGGGSWSRDLKAR